MRWQLATRILMATSFLVAAGCNGSGSAADESRQGAPALYGGVQTSAPVQEAPNPPSAQRIYTRADLGFSCRLPMIWHLEEDPVTKGRSHMAFLMRPEETGATVNVVVESLPAEVTTIDHYWPAAMAHIGRRHENLKGLEQGTAEVGSQPARWHRYSVLHTGVQIEAIQYMTVHKGRAYVISYAATPESFDQHRKEFDQVVRSFRFLP